MYIGRFDATESMLRAIDEPVDVIMMSFKDYSRGMHKVYTYCIAAVYLLGYIVTMVYTDENIRTRGAGG